MTSNHLHISLSLIKFFLKVKNSFKGWAGFWEVLKNDQRVYVVPAALASTVAMRYIFIHVEKKEVMVKMLFCCVSL